MGNLKDLLRRLFGNRGDPEASLDIELVHPVLGAVRRVQGSSESFEARIESNGREIRVSIELDSIPLDEVLLVAADACSKIEELIATAENTAVRDLIGSFNEGWKDYDEVQDDGSIKAVVKPRLSSDEFKARLLLDCVSVLGDSCIDVWFHDSGLFWGHSVHVSSLEGVNFSNAEAQIFG